MTGDDGDIPIRDSEGWTGSLPDNTPRFGLAKMLQDSERREKHKPQPVRVPIQFGLKHAIIFVMIGVGFLIAAYFLKDLFGTGFTGRYPEQTPVFFLILLGVMCFLPVIYLRDQ